MNIMATTPATTDELLQRFLAVEARMQQITLDNQNLTNRLQTAEAAATVTMSTGGGVPSGSPSADAL